LGGGLAPTPPTPKPPSPNPQSPGFLYLNNKNKKYNKIFIKNNNE